MSEHYKSLVSVIMPAYNRAHVIGRAIKSVLAQTYNDFELIIVDDGSSDKTEEVVRSFDDPRIRFLRHERNRGVCAARNTGIKASQGDFITFLDSDDEFTPARLQEQVSALKKYGANNIFVTGTIFLDDNGARVQTTSKKETLCPCQADDIYESFFSAGRNSPQRLVTMMTRRQFLDEVGLFDEQLPASEFWDLGLRLAKKYRYQVIDTPLEIVHRDAGARTWNTANRLKATRRLLAKYQLELSSRPRAAAHMKLVVGVLQLRSGHMGEGRRLILEAWRLNLSSPRTYAHLLASILMPPIVYQALARNGLKHILYFRWLRPSIYSLVRSLKHAR